LNALVLNFYLSKKVVFKYYNKGQLSLLKQSYDGLAPINNPIRILKRLIVFIIMIKNLVMNFTFHIYYNYE